MGSKIYVGGLPYSATEQQLNELFAAHDRDCGLEWYPTRRPYANGQ